MTESNRTKLLLEFRQPTSPAKNSVLDIPYEEEGKCLAASIEEDIGSFSLHPKYSIQQLRSIKRIKMRHSPREIRRKSRTTIPLEAMEI